MGVCFPIYFISQVPWVMMLHKDPSQDSGFQTISSHRPAGPPLVLSGKTELDFWCRLLLSDSPSWNPPVDVTTSTFFHAGTASAGKREEPISSTSQRLWRSLWSQLQNQPPLQSQLPCEGLSVRGMKACGGGCLRKEPRFHTPGRCQSVRAPRCHGVVPIHIESSPGEGG